MRTIFEFQGEHRFLSNFWPSPMLIEGLLYGSVEHAYQAMKTIVPLQRAYIASSSSPGIAKRRGRVVEIRADWEEVKVQTMQDLVRVKFTNPELAALLLATGDAPLKEGNRWNDTFWGVNLRTGLGQNILGQILMDVRSNLRKGASNAV